MSQDSCSSCFRTLAPEEIEEALGRRRYRLPHWAKFFGILVIIFIGGLSSAWGFQGEHLWVWIFASGILVSIVVAEFLRHADSVAQRIRRGVIGARVHFFLDENGHYHVHPIIDRNARVYEDNTGHSDQPLLTVHTLNLAHQWTQHRAFICFDVTVNGLFSRHRIFGRTFYWKIERVDHHYYHGYGFSICDRDGCALIMSPEQALSIVNRFNSLRDMLVGFARVEDQKSFLVSSIDGIMEEIRDSKETMGRSKHAQAIRETLFKLLYRLDELELGGG